MEHMKEDDLQNGNNCLNTSNPYEQSTVDITSIPREVYSHHISIQTDSTDMDTLGQIFECCIEEVHRLETHRDKLIEEYVQLQKPMMEVVRHLRDRLVEAQRLLAQVQLDYISVYEDVQQVKRRLFIAARDCIQSQVTLAKHQYEVAQSGVTQEEHKTTIESLTEEKSDLQNTQRERVSHLKSQAKPRSRTMSDSMSLCRQVSLRLQRRLSGSLKTLESWYEPRLMALLRRKQMGDEALKKSREQATDLQAQLGPLREDVHRLETQRTSLEQRITLMEEDGEQNLNKHKENVEKLKGVLNDLELEFEVQRNSKNSLQELKEGLMRELTFLRGSEEGGTEDQFLSKS
uniref:Syncoilin n=1 Tax=Neogobius melanostomus TaxID=47308 RepID=A0A8C6ULV7_9GOBI